MHKCARYFVEIWICIDLVDRWGSEGGNQPRFTNAVSKKLVFERPHNYVLVASMVYGSWTDFIRISRAEKNRQSAPGRIDIKTTRQKSINLSMIFKSRVPVRFE